MITGIVLAVIVGGFSLAAGGSVRGTRDWFRAVRYLAKGNMYSAVGELEKIDTGIARTVLKAARRSAYRKGVRAYHAGEYGEAAQMFRICGETGDSGRYAVLANAHLSDCYYNDATSAGMMDRILEMWGFEDAPDALVSNMPGALCFPAVAANADGFAAVEDEYLLKGMKLLLSEGKLLAEPSSAIGLGAVLQGLLPVKETDKVCFVISGGSVSLEQLDMLKGI